MRHGRKVHKISRTHSHRSAMLSNMASSLIKHKRIETTLAKAKALRVYVEPLITKSKTDTTHQRRIVFSYLRDKEAVAELFREVSPKVMDRNGGYTRILKLGQRQGDGAEMAIIELVDFNENMYKEEKTDRAKTTRRSRTRRSKTTTSQEVEATTAETTTEEVVEEVVEEEVEASAEETAEAAPAPEAEEKTEDNTEETSEEEETQE